MYRRYKPCRYLCQVSRQELEWAMMRFVKQLKLYEGSVDRRDNVSRNSYNLYEGILKVWEGSRKRCTRKHKHP